MEIIAVHFYAYNKETASAERVCVDPLESQGRPVLNVMVQMEPTLPPTTIGLRVFRQEK